MATEFFRRLLGSRQSTTAPAAHNGSNNLPPHDQWPEHRGFRYKTKEFGRKLLFWSRSRTQSCSGNENDSPNQANDALFDDSMTESMSTKGTTALPRSDPVFGELGQEPVKAQGLAIKDSDKESPDGQSPGGQSLDGHGPDNQGSGSCDPSSQSPVNQNSDKHLVATPGSEIQQFKIGAQLSNFVCESAQQPHSSKHDSDFSCNQTDTVSPHVEDGHKALPIAETKQAQVVLGLNSLSEADRDEFLDDVANSTQQPSATGEKRSKISPPTPSFCTPLSQLAETTLDARVPDCRRTWPHDSGLNRTEVAAFRARPSQPGLSVISASPEPLSTASTKSDQSVELKQVMRIGITGKNGDQQWQLLTLDTGSDVTVVAHTIVNGLGLEDKIQEYTGKDIHGIGGWVTPLGQIELSFSPYEGRKTFKTTFLVLHDKDLGCFDAIASFSLIKTNGWYRWGEPSAFPMKLR